MIDWFPSCTIQSRAGPCVTWCHWIKLRMARDGPPVVLSSSRQGSFTEESAECTEEVINLKCSTGFGCLCCHNKPSLWPAAQSWFTGRKPGVTELISCSENRLVALTVLPDLKLAHDIIMLRRSWTAVQSCGMQTLARTLFYFCLRILSHIISIHYSFTCLWYTLMEYGRLWSSWVYSCCFFVLFFVF